MPHITFTDSTGIAKLHNGKPHPATRFDNWVPDSNIFGESAARQSDGAITAFRLRDDYACSFELSKISAKRSSNLVLQSENFGTTWVANNTPTRAAAAHVVSGVSLDLLGDDDVASIEYYDQPVTFTGNGVKAISIFVKKGTSPAASGSVLILRDTTAPAYRLLATITFDTNSAPSVVATTGTYLGYQPHADGVYRLLFSTSSVTAANTNDIQLQLAGTLGETGNLYAGGVQAEDNTTPTDYLYNTTATKVGVALSDIADRLKRHLLNGGSCSVRVTDASDANYATCGLKPGTVPSLTLSDRRALEYTLSLALLNIASSPVAMVCRYAEG